MKLVYIPATSALGSGGKSLAAEGRELIRLGNDLVIAPRASAARTGREGASEHRGERGRHLRRAGLGPRSAAREGDHER